MFNDQKYTGLEVAVIGMSCRFPGADSWRSYWNNLKNGIESIEELSDQELTDKGIESKIANDPKYVKTKASLKDKDSFDSSFFDYRISEATLMSPQHRIFHECVWEALEDSGYTGENFNGLISLYAGAGEDLNWRAFARIKNSDQKVDDYTLNYLSNKDYLTSLVSYKLNLKGPSITINTACSTSLVAVNLACKSLLLGDSVIALAGGVSILTNVQKGYLHNEGSIFSSDGHCRAFNENSSGTVESEGAGVVVLKRLSDALKDGDNIHAIIKGSAINNDGNRKVGFTAPSVDGQVECVKKALRFAQVMPESIGYIEAHGTGTRLGDPIEIESLKLCFKDLGIKNQAIGSVKTNIGHTDTAAGIAGLIKAVLSLKFKKLLPHLNFIKPNPAIDFDQSSFYINTKLMDWNRTNNSPLRACVSSFGIGGTNAHVVLEEAPDTRNESPTRKHNFLSFSAKSESSLRNMLVKFRTFLLDEPQVDLSDAAYTLHKGRRHFAFRKAITFDSREGLLKQFEMGNDNQTVREVSHNIILPVYLFSGGFGWNNDAGRSLYQDEPLFRAHMDLGFSNLRTLKGNNYYESVFMNFKLSEETKLDQDLMPLIFIFEYSLAKLIQSLGIEPKYLMGYGIGEYVAVTVSGLISFETALRLVVKRGEILGYNNTSILLSTEMTEDAGLKFIKEGLELVTTDSDSNISFCGDKKMIFDLSEELEEIGIVSYLSENIKGINNLKSSVIENFRKEFDLVVFDELKCPIVSFSSGKLITKEEFCSVDYWLNQVDHPINFQKAIKNFTSNNSHWMFLEIGSDDFFASSVNNADRSTSLKYFTSFNESTNQPLNGSQLLMTKVSELWEAGLDINWKTLYLNEKRTIVALPTYPFDHTEKFPVEVNSFQLISDRLLNDTQKRNINFNEWFYSIQWSSSVWIPTHKILPIQGCVLVFVNDEKFSKKVCQKLAKDSLFFIEIKKGQKFERVNKTTFILAPDEDKHYNLLFKTLRADGIIPTNIYHLWSFESNVKRDKNICENYVYYQAVGYESILNIIRAFNEAFSNKLHIDVISNGWYKILENDSVIPIKATSLAAVKVVPLEFSNISCRAIDIGVLTNQTITGLFLELYYKGKDSEVSIRGSKRFTKNFKKEDFLIPENSNCFKHGGTYLITGASGGMGKLFSKFLSRHYSANMILIGRSDADKAFLEELESTGSRVCYVQADITDYFRVEATLKEAEKELGAVNGVIHTAGVGDYEGVILKRNKTVDSSIFKPKILGSSVLNGIFSDRKLDFLVHCSSSAASCAPFGQVGYVAANLFLDAVAEQGNSNFPVISIQWTALQEIGMAFNSLNHLEVEKRDNALKNGLGPNDALKVLSASIYLSNPVPIISTIDFNEHYKKHYIDFKNSAIDHKSSVSFEETLIPTNNTLKDRMKTEEILKSIFKSFFEITEIDNDSDFFELGGDSLSGMMLLNKIRSEFEISLTLKDFFENSTIHKLMLFIENAAYASAI